MRYHRKEFDVNTQIDVANQMGSLIGFKSFLYRKSSMDSWLTE